MDFHQPSNIYQNDKTIPEDNLEQEFYTLSGLEEVIVNGFPRRLQNDNRVYAKKLQKRDGSFKHMIKTANDGKLYNPVSVYGQEKTSTFLDRICKSNDKFTTVNEKAFGWYIQFLSSKNLAWLHNAEREVD